MLAGCELSTAALLSLKSACDLAGQGRAAEARQNRFLSWVLGASSALGTTLTF